MSFLLEGACLESELDDHGSYKTHPSLKYESQFWAHFFSGYFSCLRAYETHQVNCLVVQQESNNTGFHSPRQGLQTILTSCYVAPWPKKAAAPLGEMSTWLIKRGKTLVSSSPHDFRHFRGHQRHLDFQLPIHKLTFPAFYRGLLMLDP